jgi:MFS family permease
MASPRAFSPAVLIGGMFAAEVVGMLAIAAFPALLPQFSSDWRLSNTEAGWISGVYFAGFVLASLVLGPVTDRIESRQVFIAGHLVGGLGTLGFAFFAEGLVSATLWRCLQGIGFAGTYMPGLKALTEAVPDRLQSRATAFYTASFTVGNGASFFATGELAAAFGWRPAFALLALGSLAAAMVAFVLLRSSTHPISPPAGSLLDFRSVFGNRRALGHMIAYGAHNSESSILRAWAVAFLVFAQGHGGAGTTMASWSPTTVAALANFLGFPAVIAVGELTRYVARRWLLLIVMLSASLVGIGLGATATVGIALTLAIGVLYVVLVIGDSGTINAGLVAAIPVERRGQTMALHALFGFAGSFIGPVVFGAALDLAAASGWTNPWPLAFVAMLVIVGVGALALVLLDRPARAKPN